MRFVFKVPYDTRRTITACKVSFVRAAWIPWQGNQRLRATANDPYRPLLFRHTHRRRPTNNMDEVLSPTSTCYPSVRPSVSRRAFVLRYIVQACLLRETNGAPLVHSPPCLNFLRREIHRSPELRSISGPPSSVYYPITHTVLPYYLQVHSLSLSLSQRPTHPIANCSAGKFQTLFLSLLPFWWHPFCRFLGNWDTQEAFEILRKGTRNE